MSVQIGYLDNNGHPKLTIRVSGTHPTANAIVEAMIDTGFTGFLMLPIAQALPLGLALYGTGNYTLADGSTVTNFLAEGTVTIMPPTVSPVSPSSMLGPPTTAGIQPESMHGTVVLGGDGPLLGMEFIRGLDKLLLVGKVVILVDNSMIDATIAAASVPPTISAN